MRRLALALTMLIIVSPTVHAYIGPGAGISVLDGIISVAAGVLVTTGVTFLWPVRKALKRRKAGRDHALEQPET